MCVIFCTGANLKSYLLLNCDQRAALFTVFACLFYYNSVVKSKLENIFLILCSVKIDSFSLGLIKNSFLKIYVSDPALIRRVLKVIQNPKCERMKRMITPCGSHWYSTQGM